jgi:hypothetical protein
MIFPIRSGVFFWCMTKKLVPVDCKKDIDVKHKVSKRWSFNKTLKCKEIFPQ